MRCPQCGCEDDKVVETRVGKDGDTIRRRRECLRCGERYTTREALVLPEILVVKRDGTREDFDPEKLRRGIELACWKRPVRDEQVDRVVEQVMADLLKRVDREVPSHLVGEMVMSGLQTLDEVAYVRFASVYRRFKDIDQFIDEVKCLVQAQNDRQATLPDSDQAATAISERGGSSSH